jgi:peptidoglycan/xylan/chitin deacetylase (PgdA/CDA1 family)
MRRSCLVSLAALVVAPLVAACHAAPTARPRPAEAPPSLFRLEGVATWRGDATAAYSLIHDDVCDPATRGVFDVAVPELEKRGLHAGFGVIVSACDDHGWEAVRRLVAHGHDVFSHSWDHPCLTKNKELAESCDPKAPRSVDFEGEIGRAATRLTAATGRAPDFFIFPYDVCDPGAIAYLKAHGFLAARCGEPGTNGSDWKDPFAIRFDVYGPSYSKFFGAAPCQHTARGATPAQYTTPPADYPDGCRRYVLDNYVDEAIAAGGWAVRELHGLDPADPKGWETVAVADYRAHLDRLAERVAAGALWVDGPTEVTRYRFARDAAVCAPPRVVDGHVLRFAAPTPECRRFATVLSWRVATVDGSDPHTLVAEQGGQRRPARRLGPGRYVVDADPTAGDARLVP